MVKMERCPPEEDWRNATLVIGGQEGYQSSHEPPMVGFVWLGSRVVGTDSDSDPNKDDGIVRVEV